MSKILLVDTNVSASPIYRYLVGSGAEVFVVGGNPNDYLARTATNYVNLDYSNIDALVDQVDRLGIDYLVPGCNDRSYLACAEINQRRPYCGIDSVEATEVINNKERFRRFAADAGIPVPRVFPLDRAETEGQVIVKPVDAFSGRGTTVVFGGDRQALDAAISAAESFSRSNTCIVEEYITGRLYSHSAFISGNAIVADFIVEEHGTANPFVVDTSRVDYAFPSEMLRGVRDEVVKMAKRLSLQDGLIHTQFLVDGDRFWLVEVTRRCPGDLYSQLIELSTGFPYCEAYARPFIGQAPIAHPKTTPRNWITRHTVSLSREQHFESVEFTIPMRIVKWVPLAIAGDLIRPSPFSRIGLLFAESESKAEQDQLFERMLRRAIYRVPSPLEMDSPGEQHDAP
jgi:biotin carboxylase